MSSSGNRPAIAVWKRLGLVPEAELHGGHQSRVFAASRKSGRVVVKMIRAATTDVSVVEQRAKTVLRIAEDNPAVVAPVPLGTDLVTEINGWLAIGYPFVEGRPPSIDDRGDVEEMANTLVKLHQAFRFLEPSTLPPVRALSDTADNTLDRSRIIHGDYAVSNLIITPSGLKVIDFDECGRGSIEFELGNSLYMVNFDAWLTGDLPRYHQFRTWFLDAYVSATPTQSDESLLDMTLIDTAIEARTAVLRRWLADPPAAPTGIRNASTEWRTTLQRFVDEDWS